MNHRDILFKYGFSSNFSSGKTIENDTIANGLEFSGDYHDQNIKRLKLTKCDFKKANFNDSAVTGSMFIQCTFKNCDMDQGDFEYCDFKQCTLMSNKPISIAFDNTNFVRTNLCNLKFYSSTFSNTYFDESDFYHVSIKNCTLENAIFQNCKFYDMDLSHLNLDFVDFRNPYFENCCLPMSQIVYTFGLLEYLMSTSDDVMLVGNGKRIKPTDFINVVLPALLQSYLEVTNKSKVYFPLINILLALGQKEEADHYLGEALNFAASMQDFRMIKYYCKLMSLCDCYTLRQKKKTYRRICDYFNRHSMSSWQLKDYSRNIGDIKYILIAENNLPRLIFNFYTNIYHTDIEKIGLIARNIFNISGKYSSEITHDMYIELRHNSPIAFSVYFTESIDNVMSFLQDLLLFICCTVNDNQLQLKDNVFNMDLLAITQCEKPVQMLKYIEEYNSAGITLTLSNYHIENWKSEYAEYKNIKPEYNNHQPRIGENT